MAAAENSTAGLDAALLPVYVVIEELLGSGMHGIGALGLPDSSEVAPLITSFWIYTSTGRRKLLAPICAWRGYFWHCMFDQFGKSCDRRRSKPALSVSTLAGY